MTKEKILDSSFYFKLQADIGVTKHMGGDWATRELFKRCHIEKGHYVLDVGCGVGVTSSLLAKEFGCQVEAVDIYDKMVGRAIERSVKEEVSHLVNVQVADAQQLPFPDNTFHALITESVTSFVPNPMQALREYYRVVKPGGYVGLSEATWHTVPDSKLVEYIAKQMQAELLTKPQWERLLLDAGFVEVRAELFSSQWWHEAREQLKRFSGKEYVGMWGKFIKKYVTNPEYRQFAREAVQVPDISQFVDYIGYGLYVGQVPFQS